MCWEDWRGPYRQVYGVFLFITQFTVPIAVSSVAYTMIINKLATRGWSHKEEVKDLNVRKMLKNLFLGSR